MILILTDVMKGAKVTIYYIHTLTHMTAVRNRPPTDNPEPPFSFTSLSLGCGNTCIECANTV